MVLLAARASRPENQDAIDAAIVNMLSDSREVRNVMLHSTPLVHVAKPIIRIKLWRCCRHVQTSKKFTSCLSILLTNEQL